MSVTGSRCGRDSLTVVELFDQNEFSVHTQTHTGKLKTTWFQETCPCLGLYLFFQGQKPIALGGFMGPTPQIVSGHMTLHRPSPSIYLSPLNPLPFSSQQSPTFSLKRFVHDHHHHHHHITSFFISF